MVWLQVKDLRLRVWCYCLPVHEVVEIWISIARAARQVVFDDRNWMNV